MLLASTQLVTASPHICLNALWLILHKFPGVGLFQSINNFVISGIRLAHEDVLFNGRVKEDGFLLDVADLLAELAQLDFIKEFIIDEDLAFSRLVEALDKLHDCALA